MCEFASFSPPQHIQSVGAAADRPALTPPHHSGAVMRHFLHRAWPSVEKKTADGRLCTLQYMRPFSRSLSLGSFLFFFIIPPTPATTRRTTDIRVLKWSAGEDFSVFGNPNFQHEPWVKAAGVLFFGGAAAEDETTGAANMIWVPVVFM